MKRTNFIGLISLLLFSLLINPSDSEAQKDVEIKWGPEYKYDRRAPIQEFIGQDKEGFYILRAQRKSYVLEKYAFKNFNLLLSQEFELPKPDRDYFQLMEIFRVDGQMLVFSMDHDKRERTTKIYVQELSDKGILSSKYKLLDQITYDEKRQSSSFELRLSSDTTKFLLYRNQDFDKHSNEQFTYKVYDKSLNLLWEKGFELPYRDQVVGISKVKLGDEGNIYMISTKDPDKKRGEKRERKIQNRKFNIFAFYPETDELRQYEIDLGIKKWIAELNYTINTEGDIMVTGFYSNEDAITMDGTFFLKIDKESKEVIHNSMKPFDKDFKSNFLDEKEIEKGKKDIGVFDMYPAVLRDDGGILQIAQYYQFFVSTYTDSKGNTTRTYHYIYNDIMVINISPEGEIEWISVVPKKQHTTNDGGYYSSYSLIVNEDKIHFIFNDNPKNIIQYEKDPLKLKNMSNPKKSLTMVSTVDSDGNMRRASLFHAKDIKTILIPRFSYSLGHGKKIIYGIHGSKYKFGSMDFTNY